MQCLWQSCKRIQVSSSACLRLRFERKFNVICPSGGPGEARGLWGRRRRRPGLRDQKDLLDESCVCVMHAPERSRFCFFPNPFSTGPPLELRTTPFLCFKACPAFSHFCMLWFGGFPEYLGKEERKKNVFSVSEVTVVWIFLCFLFFFLPYFVKTQ